MKTLFENNLNIDHFKLTSERERPAVEDWLYDYEKHQYDTYRHFYYETKPDMPNFYVSIGVNNQISPPTYTVYVNNRGVGYASMYKVSLDVSDGELYDIIAWNPDVALPDDMIRDIVSRMREFIESPDGQPEFE